MKKPIAHVLVKREFFIALLFLFNAFAANAQWTYTITVKQTGRCIPFPTHAPIPFYTKSACEADRQGNLSQSGSDWSTFGDGSCTTIITCTPCVGSDIDQGSTSGQGGPPNQTNPGDVSIQGPMNGDPFFSSHPSMSFEEWESEIKQILATLGNNTIIGKNYTLPGIPMGNDKYLNAAYAIKSMNYEPKTKPVSSSNAPIQDAGSVDLKGKFGVVPADYSNYNKKVESLYSIKLKSQVPPLPDAIREIENTVDNRIDNTREILVDVAGLLPPGLNYATIAAVDGLSPLASVIYNCMIRTPPNCPPTLGEEAAKKAVINFMEDFGSAAIGDLSGNLLNKFKVLNKTNIGTNTEEIGKIVGVNNKKTMSLYEILLEKKDMKKDIIPAIVGVSANKVQDFFTTQKNDW